MGKTSEEKLIYQSVTGFVTYIMGFRDRTSLLYVLDEPGISPKHGLSRVK